MSSIGAQQLQHRPSRQAETAAVEGAAPRRCASRRGRLMRLLAAVVGAVLANVMILAGLSQLNAPPVFETQHPPELRVAMHEEPEPEPVQPEEPDPEPEPMQTQVTEVSLERPRPEMEAAAASMALELPSFEVAQPRVAVRSTPTPTPAETAPAEPTPARATGPVTADTADKPGRAVRHPQPEYPRVALRRRATGHVLARVLVDEDGRVEQVEIDKVEGHSAFESAVRQTLLSRWEYSTTYHRGRPVRAWHQVTIRFRLDG